MKKITKLMGVETPGLKHTSKKVTLTWQQLGELLVEAYGYGTNGGLYAPIAWKASMLKRLEKKC